MDEPDEFDLLDDDFVLDESALAALDTAEKSFFSAAASTSEQPPTKKQKLSASSWTARPHQTPAIHDDEDLPDISINPDGSYAIQSQHTRVSRPATVAPSRVPSTAISKTTTVPLPPRAKHISVPAHSSTMASASSSRPSSSGRSSHRGQQSAPQRTQASATTTTRRPTPSAPPPRPRLPTPLPEQDLPNLSAERDAEVEQLRGEKERLDRELAESTKIKYARDGEINILRKNMEKTAKEHDTQLLALRQAKEEGEARLARAQKEMKEELERMKTQFLFKQHELEATTRKVPGTVRSKRMGTIPPATPFPLSQYSQRIQPMSSAGPSRLTLEDTPMRPPPPPKFRPSPKKLQRASQSPDKKKKTLPGFQNSFLTSTPVRSPSSSKFKEKEKEKDDLDFWDTPSRPVSSQRQHTTGMQAPLFPVVPDFPATVYEPPPFPPTAVEMPPPASSPIPEDNLVLETVEDEDELEDLPAHSWKSELSRLMISHAHNSENLPTLQLLMKADAFLLEDDRPNYVLACSKILESVTFSNAADDYQNATHSVCTHSITLLHALNNSEDRNLVPTLAALLHLLTILIYCLPDFSTIFLSLVSSPDEPSRVLDVTYTLILKRISPISLPTESDLAHRIIDFFEALCWRAADDGVDRLASCGSRRDVLGTLLNPTLPALFLARVMRSLSVYVMEPRISKSFLDPSIDEQTPPTRPGTDRTILRLSHIEQTCTLLIDLCKKTDNKENFVLKLEIVSFFGILSTQGDDGASTLNRSPTLIPALVLFITRLTAPIWEIDVDSMDVDLPISIPSSIRALHQTLFLLHHLVISTDSASNLRQRLQQAPYRLFNGITHMFVVSFGRMSYCEAPEWLDEECKVDLEIIHGMAQDLLELVVVGPEVESVYEAFNDKAQSEETDEEDMEAELLGNHNR